MADSAGKGIGGRIAPPRFLAFLVLAAIGVPLGMATLGWRLGVMAGFDLAAAVFLVACISLLDNKTDSMRAAAKRNDANRALLLGLTAFVSLVVLAAVASELAQQGAPHPKVIVLIIATLTLAWLFSNMVYALHYAHLFYQAKEDGSGDTGGLGFPKTDEPDYWDFIYFAFCLGMTFQTSDVDTEDRRFRRVVTAHCLAAFVFNLGILAFTINVLGGG